MKTFLKMLSFVIVGAMTVISCIKAPNPSDGTISISINGLWEPTKAGYVSVQSYESTVRSMEVVVFSNGSDDDHSYLELYHSADASEILSRTVVLNVKSGAKKVYVVVNGPKDGSILKASLARNVRELKDMAIDLSDNVVSGAEAGFVCFGGSSVASGSTTVDVNVSRITSRVALRTVTNNLPSAYSGALTIRRAWVANVVGNQNLAADAAVSVWYNRQSRVDKATQVASEIINGSTYTASCPSLTFREIGYDVERGSSYSPLTPPLFYFFANPSATDPNGFISTFAAQKTTLVLEISISGAGVYYYPVVLPDGLGTSASLGTNTAYTVDITVKGLGESDPNKPVNNMSVTANVSLVPWTEGAPYSESI